MLAFILFLLALTRTAYTLGENKSPTHYRGLVRADKDQNKIIIGEFPDGRNLDNPKCTVEVPLVHPCAYTKDGYGFKDGKKLLWCPAYKETKCSGKYIMNTNGSQIWTGCVRYRIKGVTKYCSEGFVFDVLTGQCRDLAKLTRDPCIAFWGDETMDRIIQAVKDIKPITVQKGYKVYIVNWMKLDWQYLNGPGSTEFRLCRTAWDNSGVAPFCKSMVSGMRYTCVISDQVDKYCEYGVRNDDNELLVYPEELDKSSPSGYLAVEQNSKDLVHHSKLELSDVESHSDSTVSCERPGLLCGQNRFLDYSETSLETWVSADKSKSESTGMFMCNPTDSITTTVDCHNLCLVRGGGLCKGDEAYETHFDSGDGFNCFCNWVNKTGSRTVYVVGGYIYFEHSECVVETDCRDNNHIDVKRVGRRLTSMKEEVSCSYVSGVLDCGPAPCHFLMTAANASVAGRTNEIMGLTVSMRSRIKGFKVTIKLFCDVSVNRAFESVSVSHDGTAVFKTTIDPEDICVTLGPKSILLAECASLHDSIIEAGTSRLVQVVAAVWLIIVVIWSITLLKKFLYNFGFMLDGQSVSDSLLEVQSIDTILDEQIRIIKLNIDRATTKCSVCSIGWWTRRQMRSAKKICLAYYLYLMAKGYTKNNAWKKAAKFWRAAGNNMSLKDPVLEEIVSMDPVEVKPRNFRPKTRTMPAIMVLLAFLSVLNVCESKCSGGSYDVSSSSCTVNSDTTMECDIEMTIMTTIDVVGESTCFNMENKTTGEVVGKVEVEYTSLERLWSLQNLYYTGHWTLATRKDQSCYDGGWCTSRCDGNQKNWGYRDQLCVNGHCKVQPVQSVCCYWFVTIFTCGSSYRCGGLTGMLLTTTGGDHGWVRSVGRGEPSTTVTVTVNTTAGDSKLQKGVIKGVGSQKVGPVQASVKSVSNLPQITYGQHKILTIGNTSYLIIAADVNNPVKNMIGDVQSQSRQAWVSPSIANDPDDQHKVFKYSDVMDLSCSSYDSSASSSKPGISLLHTLYEDAQLPITYQGSLFKSTSDFFLIEELSGGRPLTVEIKVTGKYNIKHIKEECAPEIKFIELIGCYSCYSPGAVIRVETRSNNPFSCTALVKTSQSTFTCPGSIDFSPGEFKSEELNCISTSENNEVDITVMAPKQVKFRVEGKLLADKLLAEQLVSEAGIDEETSTFARFSLSALGISLISISGVTVFIVVFVLLACFCSPFRDCLVIACPFCRSVGKRLPDRFDRFKKKLEVSGDKADREMIKLKAKKDWQKNLLAQENYDKRRELLGRLNSKNL